MLIRAIGPSLTGVTGALADPVLDLHRPGGMSPHERQLEEDPVQDAAILATGLAPTNNLESAIDTTESGATPSFSEGRGRPRVWPRGSLRSQPAEPAKLANISTRAFVSTGDNIVIAGFVLGGRTALTESWRAGSVPA